MEIKREEVLKVAHLARLKLTEEAIDELALQLGDILKYMDTLKNIDTKGVPPTFHTISKKDSAREDIAGIHLPKDKTLENAPYKDEESFLVPKVIQKTLAQLFILPILSVLLEFQYSKYFEQPAVKILARRIDEQNTLSRKGLELDFYSPRSIKTGKFERQHKKKDKSMKQWYEELFENFARSYDDEEYTKGTAGECDFIEKEIGYNKRIKIIDIGCGTGRHSIELSKRGYSVTGIDLSESQLKRAKEKASAEALNIDFRKKDARAPHFSNEFDLAIMLCEGGFSLMETDEMNFLILENAANALKSNGKFIFTALNGLFPLFHSVKDFFDAQKKDGADIYKNNRFDLMTFRDHHIIEFTDDSGKKKSLDCNERYYVPSEISWLLKSLDFKTIDIFGAKLGAFSRNDELTTEDFEMLVIAGKE